LPILIQTLSNGQSSEHIELMPKDKDFGFAMRRATGIARPRAAAISFNIPDYGPLQFRPSLGQQLPTADILGIMTKGSRTLGTVSTPAF
jgi:hypothetical protein